MQASRHAPAVRLEGRSDRRWQWAVRAAAGLVVGGTIAWWLSLRAQGSTGLAPRVIVPVAALLCAAAAAWPRRAVPWQLHWDGAGWYLDARPCRPDVKLDVGRWLLLRLSTADGIRWLALAEAEHPIAWHALRCALYCARPVLPSPPGHGAAPTPDER